MPSNLPLLLIIAVAIVALIDYIPRAITATKKPVNVRPGFGKVPKYLIMPTVYGDISYLKNISFLRKYASKVVICTSMYETEQFYKDLDKICKKYGLRYVRGDLPIVKGKPVKNAYTIYKGVFNDLEALGVDKNTPCILIDADTYATNNVNNLVRTFIARRFSIASLRCEVSNPQSVLEILQDYEYKLAMNNRIMDPWLTSGACNMAKASVFQRIFSRHSHFFAGGDVEIGKLAYVMGYKMGHINFNFYTQVPSAFKAWYRQRIIWFAGGVRHHVINIASFSWRHYFIFFYNSLIIYLLLPLRWVELVNFPLTFFMLISISYIYLLVSTIGQGWRKEYILLPAYSFMQSMIILPVAIWRYCTYAWTQRSLGILKYDMSHFTLRVRSVFMSLNIAFAVLVLAGAGWLTVERINHWYHHGPFAGLFF